MLTVGVIGNEACDADSIVAAVVLAWFLNTTSHDRHHIPLIQCPLDDLPIRLDFQEIARIAGLDVSKLGLKSLEDQTATHGVDEWILVDHNSPSLLMDRHVASAKIVRIIDHHDITSDAARLRISQMPDKAVDIRVIGSCCSIVAEYVVANIGEWNPIPEESRKILHALLLVILTDTRHMDPGLGRTTEADFQVIDQIKKILGIVNTFSEYQRIVDSKFNDEFWRKSKISTILKYDFKDIELVGYSSVLRSISDIDEGELLDTFRILGYAVYVMNAGFFKNGVLMSESIIFFKDSGLLTAILPDLLACPFRLALISKTENLVQFKVGDPSFSRKKFAPFFTQLLKKYSF